MDGLMNGWKFGPKDGSMASWMDGRWAHGLPAGWMDDLMLHGKMHGWLDDWMHC